MWCHDTNTHGVVDNSSEDDTRLHLYWKSTQTCTALYASCFESERAQHFLLGRGHPKKIVDFYWSISRAPRHGNDLCGLREVSGLHALCLCGDTISNKHPPAWLPTYLHVIQQSFTIRWSLMTYFLVYMRLISMSVASTLRLMEGLDYYICWNQAMNVCT